MSLGCCYRYREVCHQCGIRWRCPSFWFSKSITGFCVQSTPHYTNFPACLHFEHQKYGVFRTEESSFERTLNHNASQRVQGDIFKNISKRRSKASVQTERCHHHSLEHLSSCNHIWTGVWCSHDNTPLYCCYIIQMQPQFSSSCAFNFTSTVSLIDPLGGGWEATLYLWCGFRSTLNSVELPAQHLITFLGKKKIKSLLK